jgi:hypothetical protein
MKVIVTGISHTETTSSMANDDDVTDYLLASPANAAALKEAIERIERGQTQEHGDPPFTE